ncbi:hypothetical protein [Clostridium aminobutyricum]|uniref:Uncharacterized protein n=1 Tax=Clostridium aminobutyricum TaxID=33953 RepID=A0A939D8Q4_CLOAM|nr:hypothetical protein [Clostridium aminobutyricum]MBN7773236.1 hypothetical protein [Clostridium aminobutyricum]
MKQPKAPCFGCDVVEAECKVHCDKYIAYSEQYKAYKELVDKARGRDTRMDVFKFERVEASIKAGR